MNHCHKSTSKVTKHMNAELGQCIHKKLKDIVTIFKSMDIELLNVDPSLCGHQTIPPR